MPSYPRAIRGLQLCGLAAFLVLLFVPRSLPQDDLARTTLLVVRAAALLMLPGLWVLRATGIHRALDLVQRAYLAPLLGLGLLPVLFFWSSRLGVRWSADLLRLFLALLGAATVPLVLSHRAPEAHRVKTRTRWGHLVPLLALGAVFLATLGVRLWAIRGIPYPSGGDAYHHTLITQVILDTGQVPRGYEPYAPLGAFQYHFGFHTYSAFLAWVTGLPAHRAVLWGGQLVSTLTTLSIYALVDLVAKDRRAALISAVLVGLVYRLPAYYVNWGRYPQPTGEVLALPAVALAVSMVRADKFDLGLLLPSALLAAALGFTHYRVSAFYLVAMLVLVFCTLTRLRARPRAVAASVLRLASIGILALLLFSPWLPSLLHKTADAAQEVLARSDTGPSSFLSPELLAMGLGPAALAIAMLAGVWHLLRVRQRPLGVAVLVWLGIMLFIANTSLSGIPPGFLDDGTVVLAFYIPAALLVGLAMGDGLSIIAERWPMSALRLVPWTLGVLVAVQGAFGLRSMAETAIEPWYYLVSHDDVAALAWVRDNTPPDARFLVGSTFWLPEGVSGVDGGYWIPYAAGRQTTVPPMIYINEGTPEQILQVNRLAHAVEHAQSGRELAALLRSAGADHAYRGCRLPLSWHPLLADGTHFERVYAGECVEVYRLR